MLKGGRTFKQGHIYLVTIKQGPERNMIYTGKQLVEMKEFDLTTEQQEQLQQGIIMNVVFENA